MAAACLRCDISATTSACTSLLTLPQVFFGPQKSIGSIISATVPLSELLWAYIQGAHASTLKLRSLALSSADKPSISETMHRAIDDRRSLTFSTPACMTRQCRIYGRLTGTKSRTCAKQSFSKRRRIGVVTVFRSPRRRHRSRRADTHALGETPLT